jgi:DNA-binding NtrC family response regulator
LGVIKVEVPSLKDRRGDIMPIAKHYLTEFNKKFRKKFEGFTPEAEKTMLEYDWKGNVRELRNIIERGILVGKGPKLTPEDLGFETEEKGKMKTKKGSETGYPPLLSEGVDFPSIQESIEKHYIKEALRLAGGNESRAARLLNINHHTFRYRRKKLAVK